MSALPKRPRQHVIETESRQYVERVLPSEWLIEDGREDYGIDLAIEIVRDGQVTGAIFLMQLRATDSLVIRKAGYIAHRCKTSTLAYFLARTEPIVYVVYDARNIKGYWIWIQDYVRQGLKPGWKEQKTATIRIPVENVLDQEAVEEIAKRVLSYHNRAKWLAAVETAQNPYFAYRLETSETRIQITFEPKYPGALEDCPVELSGTFKFDLTDPEAKAVKEALERHLRTGEPVEVDDRFFEGFEIPEPFAALVAHEEGFRTTKILLGIARSDERRRIKVAGLDAERSVLTEIPYVELKTIQSGVEQKTLSNEEQDIPLKMSLTVNSRKCITTMELRMDLEGMNVIVAQDYLDIQKALARCKWLILTDLSSGLSDEVELPKSITEPGESFVALINALVSIQEKTKQSMTLPKSISVAEARLALGVAQVLETGRFHQRIQECSFSIYKPGAQRFIETYAGNRGSIRFDFADYRIELLGKTLSLGPCLIVLPNAEPTQDTLDRLGQLDGLPDDAEVKIELKVSKPGVYFSFPRWLPEDAEPDSNASNDEEEENTP